MALITNLPNDKNFDSHLKCQSYYQNLNQSYTKSMSENYEFQQIIINSIIQILLCNKAEETAHSTDGNKIQINHLMI